MTVPTWPAINFLADQGSLSLSPSDGKSNSASDMDNGATRVRRRFSKTIVPVSFTVQLNDDEASIFQYFHQNILKNGSFWFYMPILNFLEYVASLVRFDPNTLPTLTPIGYRTYSLAMTLSVRDLTLMTDDAYAYFSMLGTLEGNKLSNIVSKFVNVDYPHAVKGATK